MDYTILGNAVTQAIQFGEIARNKNQVIIISESFLTNAAKSWEFEDAETSALNENNESTRLYALKIN